MRRRLLSLLKAIWIVLVLGAFGYYLATNWPQFVSYAADIGLIWIIAAILLLLLGKLALAFNAREALRGAEHSLPYDKVLWIYSLSQLGRYIPGSIWQYLGRMALYRAEGVAPKKAVSTIIIESLWLLGTASAVGLALSMPQLLGLLPIWQSDAVTYGATGLVATVWLLAMLLGTNIAGRLLGLVPVQPAVAALWQVAAWLAFGLAYWAILPTEIRSVDYLALAIGAFALSWAAGYVVPFAPAGLGVREGVLLALMSGSTSPTAALAAAAMSRLLFTVVELGLGVAGSVLYRSAPRHLEDS